MCFVSVICHLQHSALLCLSVLYMMKYKDKVCCWFWMQWYQGLVQGSEKKNSRIQHWGRNPLQTETLNISIEPILKNLLIHCSGSGKGRLKSLSAHSDQDSRWYGSTYPKIEKNKCVLNWLLGNIQCFKPMFVYGTSVRGSTRGIWAVDWQRR